MYWAPFTFSFWKVTITVDAVNGGGYKLQSKWWGSFHVGLNPDQTNKQTKGKIATSTPISIPLYTVLLLSFFVESYNHCGWQSAFNGGGDKFHSPSKMELPNKPATTFNNEFQIGDLKYYHSCTTILWRWEHSTLHLINTLKLNKRGGEKIFILYQSFRLYAY